jgi:hypothetical protein
MIDLICISTMWPVAEEKGIGRGWDLVDGAPMPSVSRHHTRIREEVADPWRQQAYAATSLSFNTMPFTMGFHGI